MNPTTVRVTDKHIAEGIACSGRECPIALAVLEALADQGVKAARVMVDSYDVDVTTDADNEGHRRYRAGLDSRASRFVETFDEPEDLRDADDIAPFELELTWREMPS